MVKQLRYTVIFFSAIIVEAGCYNHKEELLYPGSTVTDCNVVAARFSADIFPLVTTKCAISGCHNAATAQGGVVLTNYTQISSRKDRIYIRAVLEKTMPATGPLLPQEIKQLKCWIEAGAPNN